MIGMISSGTEFTYEDALAPARVAVASTTITLDLKRFLRTTTAMAASTANIMIQPDKTGIS